MCQIPQLVARAKEWENERAGSYGPWGIARPIQFYKAAKDAGIKTIIGCEAYVAPGSRFSQTAEDKKSYHLVLQAKTIPAIRTSYSLFTKANLEGFII
jgi:DNA polymerase-3 subunit alpha